MKNPYIVINGNIYIRLTKSQAETLYNAGITITFYPSNYDGNFYQNLSAYHMNKAINGNTFTECVNWYESEFCYDSDTGKYTHFYIEIDQNITEIS